MDEVITPQERRKVEARAKEVKTQGTICIIYGFSCFIIAILLKFLFLPAVNEMGNVIPVTIVVAGIIAGVIGSVLFHVYEALMVELAEGQGQGQGQKVDEEK